MVEQGEDYERALAATPGGLVRGRSAWNDNEPNLASGGQDWTPLAKFLESGVEDYERALAGRSCGLVRGRNAWNDGHS